LYPIRTAKRILAGERSGDSQLERGMSLNRCLLLGLVVACAVPARADDCSAPAPCAPAFKTVTTTEWVPEHYETFKTVYKTISSIEKYTAYKIECVPEVRTRVVTVNKSVPVIKDECRTVWKCVPTVETRTAYKTETVCKTVTTVSRKCVDQGHWACKEVTVEPSCLSRLFASKCCDCEPCPKTKTVKEWVPNKVWIETPHTHTVKECVKVPYTVQVTVQKKVPVTETVKVTTHTCVPESHTETYTVNVEHKVPFEATRTVTKCVPVQEKVTATRLVPHTVEKQVPVETCSECAPKHKHKKCCD
jgi:hypothetical protein